MKKNNIILSIVIPVYNVEEYIEECLYSILNTNNSNYELLVINDGTPDNSMEIVNKYYDTYKDKIRVINQDNQGLSITRNNGINEAHGEYIWFVDSDDSLKENAIESIFKIINTHQDIEVISMPLCHCYENGTKHIDFTVDTTKIVSNYEYINNHYPFGASQRFILKKDFLLKNQLYFIPKILHEDGEFGLKILYYTDNICILNKSYYNYRIRTSGSIMSSWKRKNSEDLLYIFDSLLTLFKNNPLKRNIDCFINSLFYILIPTILFARKNWSTPNFIKFYNEKKYDIRSKTRLILPTCSLFQQIKMIFFYISPLNYCKAKIFLNNR